MPRDNDKPVMCCDCRFNINDFCRRNPPTAIMNSDPVDYEYAASIRAIFPPTSELGCFMGEPVMQRSCDNCRFERTTACHIYNELQYCLNDKSGWYCSDYEGVDK